MEKDDIDQVILAGGITRIPTVQEWVKDIMDNQNVIELDAEQTVARGATILAGLLSDREPEFPAARKASSPVPKPKP